MATMMRFKQVGEPPREIVLNVDHVLAIVPQDDGSSLLVMQPLATGENNNWNVTESIDQIGAREEWFSPPTAIPHKRPYCRHPNRQNGATSSTFYCPDCGLTMGAAS